MKRLFAAFVLVVAVFAFASALLAGIESTTVSGTKFYRSATAGVPGTFSPGEVVIFTNCVAYKDTTGTVQNMTGCTGVVKIVTSTGTGTNNTFTTNSASIVVDTSYTNGLFSFTLPVPTNAVGGPRFQLTISDGTNSAVFPPSRIGLVELL